MHFQHLGCDGFLLLINPIPAYLKAPSLVDRGERAAPYPVGIGPVGIIADLLELLGRPSGARGGAHYNGSRASLLQVPSNAQHTDCVERRGRCSMGWKTNACGQLGTNTERGGSC